MLLKNPFHHNLTYRYTVTTDVYTLWPPNLLDKYVKSYLEA